MKFWFCKWPNGDISFCYAKTLEHAYEHFDSVSDLPIEAIEEWKNPNFLADIKFNPDENDWVIEPSGDTEFIDFLDSQTKTIAEARERVFEEKMDKEEEHKILSEAKIRFQNDNSAAWEAYVKVHRRNCKDSECLFCFGF